MSQSANNQVALSCTAIVLLACSLPMTWLTIQNAEINFSGSPFGNSMPGMNFPGMSGLQVSVNGFNGSIGLGAKVPIWLLVIAACLAVGMGMMNQLQITSVPTLIPLAVLGIVAVFLIIGLATTFSGEASLGFGMILAMVGLALGAVQLLSQLGSSSTEVIGD